MEEGDCYASLFTFVLLQSVFIFFFIRVYYRCAVLVNLAMPLNSRINDDGYTGYEK